MRLPGPREVGETGQRDSLLPGERADIPGENPLNLGVVHEDGRYGSPSVVRYRMWDSRIWDQRARKAKG